MKISVVIVNYNGERYIEECVDSVLQSRTRINKASTLFFEIVVVENGSSDGSLKLLRRKYGSAKQNPAKQNIAKQNIAKQNIKVKIVVSKENKFFAGGSNLGAKEAKGEWLVFLNSDTVVDKNWLKELWRGAKGNKKLMLQPKILMHGTNKIDCVVGKYVWPGFGVAVGRGKQDNYQGLVGGDYANGTCLMVNRDWFLKLGGFDEVYRFFYEDVDLQLRAKEQGGCAVGVMKSVIEHKGSLSFKQNVPSDEVIFYYRRNRLVTVLKNFRGAEKWLRWGLLVVVSLGKKRLKMSLKAMLMSLDFYMGEVFIGMRLRELREVMRKDKFSLLDLGCGDGKLVKMAKERGIKAVGIDEKQGQTVEKFEVTNLEFFDVISMYHVLEHIKNPVKQLKRIKKWLKPNGVLVVEVPLTGNLSEKWLGDDYLIYWDKTHVNFWTKDEFLRILDEAGLRVVKKGIVWHQVFFHNITAKIGKGAGQVLMGMLLWLPFKILSIWGKNDEMIRLYCKV